MWCTDREKGEGGLNEEWNFCCFLPDSATDLHISSFSSEQLPEVQHLTSSQKTLTPEKARLRA